MRRLALLALALVTASHAQAQDAEHDACMKASGGVTSAMLDCIGAAHARADGALNRLWKERVPTLESKLQGSLREAQRQWIAYRDSTCSAEGVSWGGGSFASVALSDCRLRLTTERLRWLETIVSPDRGN